MDLNGSISMCCVGFEGLVLVPQILVGPPFFLGWLGLKSGDLKEGHLFFFNKKVGKLHKNVDFFHDLLGLESWDFFFFSKMRGFLAQTK